MILGEASQFWYSKSLKHMSHRRKRQFEFKVKEKILKSIKVTCKKYSN